MSKRPSEDPVPLPSRPAKESRFIKLEDGDETPHQYSAPPTPSATPGLDRPTSAGQPLELDAEQEMAVQKILEHENVFLTGGAGSGKTLVLRAAANELRNQGKRVCLCAPTGMAAYGLKGRTIHSHFGLDPTRNADSLDQLLRRARYGPVHERLANTDVLIIDEISMVENIFFERLNRMMQTARDREGERFGGAQLIVCGDFRQLPPIDAFSYCFHHGGVTDKIWRGKAAFRRCGQCGDDLRAEMPMSKHWAFYADAWEFMDFYNIKLQKNHRQDEEEFVGVLNGIGDGTTPGRDGRELIMNHPYDTKDAIVLMARRADVDSMNQSKFNALAGRQVDYRCVDNFDRRPEHEEFTDFGDRSWGGKTLRVLTNHQYKPFLELKVGMKVVLIANIDVDGGLVNGSQGMIMRFERYNEANLPSTRSYVDHYRDADDPQELEPSASEQYISVRGGIHHIYRQDQMKAFLEVKNRSVDLPVVRFQSGRTVTIHPDCSLTQLGDEAPFSLLSRTQIPLVPGYAMTIHKAQGLTMETVIVDLSRAFGSGMVYVALSRARKLYGLEVRGANEGLTKVYANKEVVQFMRETNWYEG